MARRFEPYQPPASGIVRAAGPGDRSRAVDLPLLLAALRPAWHATARCKDPEFVGVEFFPGRGESAEPAKQVCTKCTSLAACREWALDQDPTSLLGVWGGMSKRERQRLTGSRSEPADAA